ncbi:transposase DDE domain protein [Leptospira weilii str. Ecochallenge]|uniref:Transposase DDE domain protein n=1 Tax=Leptospira weilii str. Ecochallenge TaxID=1049986 RepID=N1U8X2_9LEPT|nr:transposase DDE domain protein [Leptospira weilii str. Ecochallenge]
MGCAVNFSEIEVNISQSLFESLYEKGIQLITKLKKNMKINECP